MKRILLLALLALAAAGCGFQKKADARFGDQHFKTAISLIELHKVRYGAYPDSLADLKFTGDWDAIALASVEYRPRGDGYELNLVRGWMGKPALGYPPEFWQGLGLIASNVKRAP
jgi:hypothetical protein